ncbi:MAG TPA: vWA domain-containing protein, partial [Planctomycetaceae bacterium]|nr:vWA domain-containing protein [Planctomycetaceae bacterium]
GATQRRSSAGACGRSRVQEHLGSAAPADCTATCRSARAGACRCSIVPVARAPSARACECGICSCAIVGGGGRAAAADFVVTASAAAFATGSARSTATHEPRTRADPVEPAGCAAGFRASREWASRAASTGEPADCSATASADSAPEEAMTATADRVQPQPRSGQAGTILLDGLVLVVLGFLVGLAWLFDIANSPYSEAGRPTLFAHVRQSTPSLADEPQVAQNDQLAPARSDQPDEPAPTKPAVEAQTDTPVEVASAPPPAEVAAAKPEDTAQMPRPTLDVIRPPPKPENKVEFFEVKAHADTVAFVVDCSSSMTGSRFWRARYELMQAIRRLQPGQKFYVIFFSSGPVALFPNQTPRLEDAGIVEKARTLRQLPTIQALGNTFPEASMQTAANLNPDIIYLLSDGEFDPLSNRLMQQIEKQQTKVHTIAFESDEGRFLLQHIAQATGGTYRFEPPKALSVDLYEQVIADFGFELAIQLPTAPPGERAKIHEALVTVASQDFGPDPGATPEQIVASTKRWRQWVIDSLVPYFEKYANDDLLEYIQHDIPRFQIAALKVAADRRINAPKVYIGALKRPDPDVVQAARNALVSISRWVDYGPKPDDDDAAKALAIAGWERWLEVREQAELMTGWTSDRIARELADGNPIHRQAAVMVIGARQLKLTDAVFPLLHDPEPDVRTAVVSVLDLLVPRDGLGPRLATGPLLVDALIALLDGDDSAEAEAAAQTLQRISRRAVSGAAVPTTAASKDWQTWWAAEKGGRAEQHLTLAKRLYDQKKLKPALLRFRDIERDYPGTKAAEQAHALAEAAQSALGDGK